MTWLSLPPRLPLHRIHGDRIHGEWHALAQLAGVTIDACVTYTCAWNRIATKLGMPTKTNDDTVTAEEWNEAVDRATARHA